jgi:hypothetical protein
MFAEKQRSVVVHEGSKEWKITGRIFPGINLLACIHRECNNTFRGWIKSASLTHSSSLKEIIIAHQATWKNKTLSQRSASTHKTFLIH